MTSLGITSTEPRATPITVLWILLPLLASALLLRIIGIESRWLWLDELLTVNWSVHGVWSAVVNVLRFDLHPPLYYLQLSVWALVSRSDFWLMANTVFWSAAAVVYLAYTASRIYDVRTGLYAGILLAVCPAALAYADTVRMYSFLVFLIIGAWYAQERWLSGPPDRFAGMWLVLSQAAVVYTHSAGLVMLSGIVLYGATRVLLTRQRPLFVKWFLLECTIGLLALPAIVVALMRGTSHTRVPDFDVIVRTWGLLTAGDSSGTTSAWVAAFGGAFIVGLGLVAVFDRRTRLPLATLVFTPLIVGAIVSYAFKPIWIPRVFLPTVPFICLVVAAAAAAGDGSRRIVTLRTAGFVGLAVAWAAIGSFQQFTRAKGDGYKPSAELVHQIARDGDVVLVDGDFNYWCFLWYYIGPDWGEPRHAFILNRDWARMMNRLPAGTAAWLDLGDSASVIRDVNVTVVLWDRAKPPPEGSGDLIVVRQQQAPNVMFADRHLASSAHIQQILVERWAK